MDTLWRRNSDVGNEGIDWLSLPPEIWHRILTLLDEDSIAQVQSCCRTLSRFATSDYLWKCLFKSSHGLSAMPPSLENSELSWKEKHLKLRNAIHLVDSNAENQIRLPKIKQVASTLAEVVSMLQWEKASTSEQQPASLSSRLVIVHPGRHPGGAFPAEATVVAAEASGCSIVASSDHPALKLGTGSGQSVFRGLELEVSVPEESEVNIVEIDGGICPSFVSCKFINSSRPGACLLVQGSRTQPYIRNCTFDGNPCHGIIIENSATGLYEGNMITNCGQIGVWIRKRATPHLVQNTIHHSGGVGVLVNEDSNPHMEENNIAFSQNSNLEVAGHSSPIVEHCTIHSGRTGGIYIHGQSAGHYRDNEVYGNWQTGVWISDHSHPFFTNNRIFNGCQGGVYFFNRGCGLLQENEIFGNAMTNIQIKDSGTRPVLQRNLVHSSQNGGIYIYDKASPIIKGNRIEKNVMAGVWVTSGAKPIIEGNFISNGRQVGVFFYNSGHGRLERNVISNNSYCGLQIKTNSNPTVSENIIHGGSSTGVLIHDEGRGVLEGNEIVDNCGSNVWVRSSYPILRRNHIHGSDVGLRISNNSRGIFEENDVLGSLVNGIEVGSNSEPLLHGNRVSSCGSCGVEFSGGSGGVLSGNTFARNGMAGIAFSQTCTVDMSENRQYGNHCQKQRPAEKALSPLKLTCSAPLFPHSSTCCLNIDLPCHAEKHSLQRSPVSLRSSAAEDNRLLRPVASSSM